MWVTFFFIFFRVNSSLTYRSSKKKRMSASFLRFRLYLYLQYQMFYNLSVQQAGYLTRQLQHCTGRYAQRLVSIVYDQDYWVSNPICSPSFRLSVSVSAQQSAFAVGVLSDLYAFHRSTENSLCPYRTPAWQFPPPVQG